MANARYITVPKGTEVTLEELTNEFLEIRSWMTDIAGVTVFNGPVDYEVQQYIQRLILRGQLDIEVWD